MEVKTEGLLIYKTMPGYHKVWSDGEGQVKKKKPRVRKD